MLSNLFSSDFSASKTAIAVIAVALLASFDLVQRVKEGKSHILFSCVLGTALSAGFLLCTKAILQPGISENGFAVAFAVVLIILSWRLLFGPWNADTKAAILGSFVFWIGLHMLWQEDAAARSAHVIAIAVALIPAIVWSALFLGYQKERKAVILLMFFAGMVATAPILFYDALVRQGVELSFFLFRIVPESFGRTTENFVIGQFAGIDGIPRTLLTVFLSFLIVGLIEETSKYWALTRSGRRAFQSIDDVLQLSIIVAIGFAFAENIVNQGYFLSFVREYLLVTNPDWAGFLGNVLGRSILTSMVHIVSTGILGYYLGLSIFAGPYLEEAKARGKRYWLAERIHAILRVQKKSAFQTQMLLQGFVCAIFLHALSNFFVTLPDVLPGNPHTLGDLMKSAPGSALHYVSILLAPALLYVVGGFWLLTELFTRKENMKVRGHIISTDSFVTTDEVL